MTISSSVFFRKKWKEKWYEKKIICTTHETLCQRWHRCFLVFFSSLRLWTGKENNADNDFHQLQDHWPSRRRNQIETHSSRAVLSFFVHKPWVTFKYFHIRLCRHANETIHYFNRIKHKSSLWSTRGRIKCNTKHKSRDANVTHKNRQEKMRT